ncbi:MAG: hypothetical protein KatS3mg033_2237 [Thermonema sp.]|jgi:hypothetical protein|nr:MAG: hypothetical protein KatS3mg033_2237 [Thermonema sp.]
MLWKAILIFLAASLFAGVGYYLDWRAKHPKRKK